MKKTQHFTGKAVADLRRYLRESHSFEEGEEIFYLAHALSFMIHDFPIEKLSISMRSTRNRFAMRKLKAVIDLLDKVFSL